MIYTVEYIEYSYSNIKSIQVNAKNKEEAYVTGYFDVLKGTPYSAWVASVQYKNGKVRTFNTFAGKPY